MNRLAVFDLTHLEYVLPDGWEGTRSDGSPTDPLVYSPTRFVMPQGWTPARPPADPGAAIICLDFAARVYSVTANFRGRVAILSGAADYAQVQPDVLCLPAGWSRVDPSAPARPL